MQIVNQIVMNIFFLDQEIETCAQYHVDKHVVKMRLELAQLACTAHHLSGTPISYIPYKPTHINHPSATWTRETIQNYCYVVLLGLALCDELDYRFGTKPQKCREVLNWLANNLPNLKSEKMTVPLLAMDQKFKVKSVNCMSDAIINYQNYYRNGKQHLLNYTNRKIPNWLL
jgi:hypothetical protein